MEHSETLDRKTYEGQCDKHGEFTGIEVEFFGKWHRQRCPTCSREHNAEEERQQAEMDRQEAEERSLRLRRSAGIPLRFDGKTLETYAAECDGQRAALAACRRLVAAMRERKQAPNMVMIGKPGTGKSHLSCGMILALCQTHLVCRIDLPDLIREIRATWHKTSEISEEQVLNRYGALDLLIIEEVGTGAGSDDERARIFQVINRRYEAMLPTVIVSNLDMDALKVEIGERVIDRLREGERSLVVFDWPSKRGAL